MKLIIHLLLLSSLSILIGAEDADEIRKAILGTIKKRNGTTSTGVRFHVNGELGKGTHSIAWKGDYYGLNVAFKLMKNCTSYEAEIGLYFYLNAIYNPEVEKHGIPNIHCHGDTILTPYWGIGMTLLEENLEERWMKQKKNISELSILLIFKQGVKILEYLNEKKIIHNDIKPANIFLRGSEVFFGDFNLACRYGFDNRGHSREFASSRYYAAKNRTFMDDLESLVFSLWYVAGTECDKVNSSSTELRPEVRTLADCIRNETSNSKMTEICNGFKNEHVQEAFMLIAADVMLKEKHAPDYKKIKKILDGAIKKIHQSKSLLKKISNSKPRFEWLTGESSRRV